ncbi:MAG: DUF5011 domain-containing protein [Candidatus Pacebacteria bacterium]|nr:DUF5011 domain-containing protein [Candidatus Paceibacterota bacterium]
MFNQFIELIKNTTTITVGTVIGFLGSGDVSLLETPPIDFLKSPSEITQELSDSGVLEFSQKATINEAFVQEPLETEGIEIEESVVEELPNMADESESEIEESVIEESPSVTDESEEDEIIYFERDEDPKEIIFRRPSSDADSNLFVDTSDVQPVISTQIDVELELVEPIIRSVNPIKPEKEIKPLDVSLILNTNFDTFDANLQIKEVTEDDYSFYVLYTFRSLEIKDRVWIVVLKENTLVVTKDVLGDGDLGNYLSDELSEVVDNEMIFLKEVQEIQRNKLLADVVEGAKKKATASVYDSLIGKILDTSLNDFSGYIPVIVEEELAVLTKEKIEEVEEPTDTESSDVTKEIDGVDNEAPVITIIGNNPALIQLGSSYLDLGANAIDNISGTLGVKTGGDVVDTTKADSYFVTYTAIDEANNTAQVTREVIIYDYGEIPEVPEEEPIVESADTEGSGVTEEDPEVIIEEPEIIIDEEEPADIEDSGVAEEEKEKDKKEKGEEKIIEDLGTTTIEELIEETTSAEDVVGEEEAEEPVFDVVDVVVEFVEEKIIEDIPEMIENVVDEVIEQVSDVSEIVEDVVEESVNVVIEQGATIIKAIGMNNLLGNVISVQDNNSSLLGIAADKSYNVFSKIMKKIKFKNISNNISNQLGNIISSESDYSRSEEVDLNYKRGSFISFMVNYFDDHRPK